MKFITWAPIRAVTSALAFSLFLVFCFYTVATNQPWLGLGFSPSPNSNGVAISSIAPSSPNSHLSVGDQVIALSTSTREVILRKDITLYDDAIDLPTFVRFNEFITHHRAIWSVLVNGDFSFVLSDGRHVPGHVAAKRPGTDLSWRFWFLISCGAITFLIGVGIWAFRPRQISTRLVLVGTSGYLYASLMAALHATHELTTPPFWFLIGIGEHNTGIEIVSYSLFALLWHYPTPLAKIPVASLCAVAVLLVSINEYLQIIQWPGNAYLAQYPLLFGAIVFLAIYKWRLAQSNAIERASLQWFLLSVVIGASIVVVLFFVPMAYTGNAIIPVELAYATGPLIYLGFALGIARYRLFDLERWWFEVWLWLAGGLIVMAIDLLLITFANLSDLLALGLALILAGWVYLPMRQWLLLKVLRPSRSHLEDYFPSLVDVLFQNGSHDQFAARWKMFVERIFQPLSCKLLPQTASRTVVADSGLALHIPTFDGSEVLEFRYRDHGRVLYEPHDATLADQLLALMRRAAALWQERENAVRVERQRIMRDLHDDVGGKLLSLMHRIPDATQQNQAREAFDALRQSIYALDEQNPLSLGDLLADLQAKLRERARACSIAVEWVDPVPIPSLQMTARHQINLQRILSEAANNAMRHCKPSKFRVRLLIEQHQLKLTFCNDGGTSKPDEWISGKGIPNIRNRATELGGNVTWTIAPVAAGERECCLLLILPLPTETLAAQT